MVFTAKAALLHSISGTFIKVKELHHYNATSYKTILFLHQHLYFPSKLAQIYNIQTKLATKVNRKLPQKLITNYHKS